MKIVYCSDALIPDTPANTVHIMRMCNAFANQGHQVVLCAHAEESDLKDIEDVYGFYGVENNFDIVKFRCPEISGGALIYALKVKRLIKKFEPDIVYGRSLYCAYFASMIKNAKVILELHKGIEKASKEALFFRRIIACSAVKGLVVISESLKEYYVKEWKIEPEIIKVAHDAAVEPKRTREIEFCNIGDYELNAGYIGHLYQGRGIDVILEVAKLCPTVYFTIVGGNTKDVSYWRKRCRECGSTNVQFKGYVSPSEVANYGMKFDVLLAPYQEKVFCGTEARSKQETSKWMSPLKVFEYMSYGKPIVCSDLPALRAILKDKETAIFCPCDVPEKWAEAIEWIMNNRELAIKIGQNAYQEFQNNYTWDQRAKKVLDIPVK